MSSYKAMAELSIPVNSDPLVQLKHFCDVGGYTYKYKWREFLNGTMIELIISYQYSSGQYSANRYVLSKIARFYPQPLVDAKASVARDMLNSLSIPLAVVANASSVRANPQQGVAHSLASLGKLDLRSRSVSIEAKRQADEIKKLIGMPTSSAASASSGARNIFENLHGTFDE